MQRTYPRVVDRNMQDLETRVADGMDLSWDVFMKALSLECAAQELQESLAPAQLE